MWNHVSAGKSTGSINSPMFYAQRFSIRNKKTEYILAFGFFCIHSNLWLSSNTKCPLSQQEETERHLLWCSFSKLQMSGINGLAGSQASSLFVSLWVDMKITDGWMAYWSCFSPLWSLTHTYISFLSACIQETQALFYFQMENVVKNIFKQLSFIRQDTQSEIMSEVRYAKCYCHQPIPNHMLLHFHYTILS